MVMQNNNKPVGKRQAMEIIATHYNNNVNSMMRDVNRKAKNVLKPNSADSWKFRNQPNVYDMEGIDDNSTKAHNWILNRFIKNNQLLKKLLTN